MESSKECGFTLIEVILSLMIISITLPLIVYLFQLSNMESNNEEIAVLHFFTFVQDDAYFAKKVTVSNDVLSFHLANGDIATIEQYQNVIRRQVNHRGHEIYIRNIQDFKLSPLSYGTKLLVTTLEGDTYEKIISHD